MKVYPKLLILNFVVKRHDEKGYIDVGMMAKDEDGNLNSGAAILMVEQSLSVKCLKSIYGAFDNNQVARKNYSRQVINILINRTPW